MKRKFYRDGDTAEAVKTVIRYGNPHTVTGPFWVKPCARGGWEVMGKLRGSHDYGGLLVTQAVRLPAGLTFRTKQEARLMSEHLLSADIHDDQGTVFPRDDAEAA